MKKLLSIAAVALLALTASAGLQVYSLSLNGTNAVAGSSATNYSGVTFSTVYTTDATISVSSQSQVANTAATTFFFDVSADNTLWTSNAMSIAVTGTSFYTATTTTNLPAGFRYPFWRLNYITNAAAATVVNTNLQLKVFTKDGI